jgi:epoxyqueuosine reductase QueG
MNTISSEHIKRFAGEKGADLIGIASIDRFAGSPEGRHPRDLLPDARSVIVVGVRVLAETVKPNLLLSALHHITLNLYHNQIAYDIGRLLDDHNYKAVVVPHRIGNLDPDLRTSPDYMNIYPKLFCVSTRHAAVEAGIGIFGTSRLLLTPRFGPRQRLAAIVTDAELAPDDKLTSEEAQRLCPPACTACIDACPGKAISREGLAWEKCNEVIRPHNGQYGYSACSECMTSCPIGKRIKRRTVHLEEEHI